MRGLFNIDSPLMRFLGKVADLMVLNLLFIFTSVPLVTLGASLTAMHYVALKMVRGEEGPVVRDYFRSFRQNLRQATVIWLILALFALILWYDLRSTWSGTGYVSTAVKVLSVTACAALVMVLLYVFGVLARFNNTVRGTVKSSVALALRHPGRTVSMFMLPFACAALTAYTQVTVRWGLLAWLALGFAAVTYFNCFLLNKTFREITGEADRPESEDEDGGSEDSGE